jgi:hypothetical protein
MMRSTIARGLLAFNIVGTVAIVAVADVFNATHLFNPEWPGHARFHIGMQFTTLVLVAIVSLWALTGPLTQSRAWLAALAPATFWPGLFVAYAIPGTDVFASEALQELGVPINLVVAGAFLAVTTVGLVLARTRATDTTFSTTPL